MKTIGNSLLANLHYIIGLYAIYSIYLVWDQYEIRNTSLDSQIPEIQEEIAVFNKKLDAIDEYKANIENSKKRIEEVFKSIEFVQKQLPAEINDIEILDFLSWVVSRKIVCVRSMYRTGIFKGLFVNI